MRLGVQACLVDGRLEPGDVEVEDGVVVAIGLEGGSRGVAIPGFVDLQVNGFAGIDFLGADADGYREAADALLETGVTAFQPTFITSSEADLVTALRAVPPEASAARPARPRCAPRRPVPLGEPARHPPRPLSLRSRPGPARAARSPPARCG